MGGSLRWGDGLRIRTSPCLLDPLISFLTPGRILVEALVLLVNQDVPLMQVYVVDSVGKLGGLHRIKGGFLFAADRCDDLLHEEIREGRSVEIGFVQLE